ncbi:MAG: hypothetical protein BWX73_00922 [Lentisphaerae bacterium ADurb.Bin082]|nr:MAG: hypothetical protein BWX73_00922 [Lentisphaerae bacterium ADurb.Bin082]
MKEFCKVIALTLVLFAALNLMVNAILQTGLKRYYCLQPAEVLVIGHSMSEMGIDRDLLEERLGLSVAKYCMNGAGTADRLVMLKHYIETTGHKPKMVIYDVSARSFSLDLADNSHALFYPFMASPVIREYLRRNASPKDYWTKRLIPLTRYDDTRFGAVIRGYRRNWKCSSSRRVDLHAFSERLKQGTFWKIGFDEESMRLFDETLAWLDVQGINCILVALPCLDLLNEAQPELYAKAMGHIRSEAEKYPNVQLHDMNGELSARHELFRDPIHLNREGQIVATSQLADSLKDGLK